MRVPMTFGAMLTLALAAACGGGATVTPTAATPTATPAGATPAPATATPAAATPAPAAVLCDVTGEGSRVTIDNFSYDPSSAAVGVDGFVTWTNQDGTSHTVTFDAGPNCGNLGGGDAVTVQFTAAGSYPYHCAIHPDMTGAVEVS